MCLKNVLSINEILYVLWLGKKKLKCLYETIVQLVLCAMKYLLIAFFNKSMNSLQRLVKCVTF